LKEADKEMLLRSTDKEPPSGVRREDEEGRIRQAEAGGEGKNKSTVRRRRPTRIYDFDELDADHVAAWSKGGDISAKNCQMLCATHNRAKGNK
jgi:hypothetical protein